MNDIERTLRASAVSLPEPPQGLGDRLAELAANEELLDVAYAHADSPL